MPSREAQEPMDLETTIAASQSIEQAQVPPRFSEALPRTALALKSLPPPLRDALLLHTPTDIRAPLDRYVVFAVPALLPAARSWQEAKTLAARNRVALVSLWPRGRLDALDRKLSGQLADLDASQGPDPVVLALSHSGRVALLDVAAGLGLRGMLLPNMSALVAELARHWRPLLVLFGDVKHPGQPAFDIVVGAAGFTQIAGNGKPQRIGVWEVCPLGHREEIRAALGRSIGARRERWQRGEFGLRTGKHA